MATPAAVYGKNQPMAPVPDQFEVAIFPGRRQQSAPRSAVSRYAGDHRTLPAAEIQVVAPPLGKEAIDEAQAGKVARGETGDEQRPVRCRRQLDEAAGNGKDRLAVGEETGGRLGRQCPAAEGEGTVGKAAERAGAIRKQDRQAHLPGGGNGREKGGQPIVW